jgi:hypothetical protein
MASTPPADALSARLRAYFRDTPPDAADAGGGEADPLQARCLLNASSAACGIILTMNVCCLSACVRGAHTDRLPVQGMWLEGDSLAPFVVTPLSNILRALECVARAHAPAHTDVFAHLLARVRICSQRSAPTHTHLRAQAGAGGARRHAVGCGVRRWTHGGARAPLPPLACLVSARVVCVAGTLHACRAVHVRSRPRTGWLLTCHAPVLNAALFLAVSCTPRPHSRR